MRNRSTLFIKAAFSLSFIAMLMYQSATNNESRPTLPPNVCIEDTTFEWTDSLNTYLLTNLWVRDFIMIFNAFWFDFTLCALLLLFRENHLPSSTPFLALMISAGCKTIIQSSYMTVGRLDGFNYYFPGLYSLIVPYHDIYDFYYSGHFATSAVLICALYSLAKRHPQVTVYHILLVAWIAFKLPYIWLYMTAVRTHYLIDFTSGICFGLLAFRLAE